VQRGSLPEDADDDVLEAEEEECLTEGDTADSTSSDYNQQTDDELAAAQAVIAKRAMLRKEAQAAAKLSKEAQAAIKVV
jgi:hypothetical protein